ncbi:MAG: hypothetical protein ACOZB3_09980 [Calditrichota bacterium]
MNKKSSYHSALLWLVGAMLMIGPLTSQAVTMEDKVRFARRNLGGPRLGMTVITGENALTRHLDEKHIGHQISQFGWHFEYQIIPEGGGPQFVVQLTPMVGGVEYGKIIPGATLAMGIRFPSGYEFGLGPNVTAGTGEAAPTALVVGVGKSFNYGGVSVPLNLVYATNPDGNRVSVIIGYAIDRR